MTAAIWHDLECGRYREDLSLWLSMAETYGAPILEVGAGTGRVSLALARAGFEVTALDHDPRLLAELGVRAAGLPVQVVEADARAFSLPGRAFALILVPMQTLQLLGGAEAHAAFMRCAAAHLHGGGAVAVAVVPADGFEEFEWQDGDGSPLPDTAERDGHLYSSQPTRVRREGDTFVLERRRESVAPDGARHRSHDRVALDVITPGDLERAGAQAGLRVISVTRIAATDDHVGSEVVVLRG